MLPRILFVYAIFFLTGLCIIAQIVRLQFFTKLKEEASNLAFSYEEVEANRGAILARDGRFLATSVPYYQIRIDCLAPTDTMFQKHIGDLSKALSELFKDKSAAAYEQEIRTAKKSGNRYKALGNRDVTHSELEQIKQFPLFRLGANRGGIIAVQRNKRNYPYGRLAFRTIGFINNQKQGVGIEYSCDFDLKGIPGHQVTQRLPGGERMPLSNTPKIRPQDGYDIQTTLDIDIQEATETALRTQLARSTVFEAATAVVMEVKTGAIRAIANMKKMEDGSYDESYNYAIGEATEPGSTFKLATLITLIEGGYLTLTDRVETGNGRWNYAGKTFSDVTSVGYGNISVLQAFAKSSNVAFSQLAVQHFSGKEKEYVERLYNMKLRENLNVEILGEGQSMVRYPTDNLWSKLSLPMMSIGYEVLLTPMHTLTLYNAIANGGRMMKPYFIENHKRYGIVEKEFRPQAISGAICSKSTIDSVKKALRYVVQEGTAKAINDSRYEISGKTGTAQIAFDGRYIDREGYRKHQASFAGFFPSDNPQYSMVVVLYTRKTRENFYGGTWAAPVFKEIADKIYSSESDWLNPIIRDKTSETILPPLLAGNDMYSNDLINILHGNRIQSQRTAPTQWITQLPQEAVTPDVRGMSLRDAIYLLERKGLKVNATGMGEVVAQTPAAGTPLEGLGNVDIVLQKPKKQSLVSQSVGKVGRQLSVK